MNLFEFNDVTEDWKRIRGLSPWDLLIHGGTHALASEHRYRRVPNEMGQLPRVNISRHQAAKPDYLVIDSGGGMEEVHFSNLGPALADTLTPQCLHILLDVTSLEVDALLLLMPLLARYPMRNLTALFLSPTTYAEHGSRLRQWSKPRQPPGYVTLRPVVATKPATEHCVLLGFDEGRVNRIIGAYDWESSRIHAILGSPPYFSDGAERAYAANRDWLEDYPRPCVHRVSASDPFAVKAFLQARFQSGVVFDILPFGPKPMVLGALLFYFALPPEDRERVRFLYDFPEYCTDHTTGVGRCFCYDLTGFSS